MPKYRVPFNKTVTAYIDVVAEDEEKANEIAGENLPEFCAQCGGWGAHGWSVDTDGEWYTSDYEDIEVIGDDEKVVNDD